MKSNYEKMYIDSSWISAKGIQLYFTDTNTFSLETEAVFGFSVFPLFYKLREQQPLLFVKREDTGICETIQLGWNRSSSKPDYYMLRGCLWGEEVCFMFKDLPDSHSVSEKLFYDGAGSQAYHFIDEKTVTVTDPLYKKNGLQTELCSFSCREGIIALKTVPSDIWGDEQVPVVTHRYFMYPHSLNLIDTVRGGVLCTYYDKDLV